LTQLGTCESDGQRKKQGKLTDCERDIIERGWVQLDSEVREETLKWFTSKETIQMRIKQISFPRLHRAKTELWESEHHPRGFVSTR
jgi:hypothetical protein